MMPPPCGANDDFAWRFGPHMADQRDHVAAHVGHHAAVVYRHLMLSEALLDQRIHVGRIHVEDEIDLALALRTAVSPPTADSVAARWLGTSPRRSA
jgi:hypothetical protein